jgi:hypothetical protein
MMAQCDRQRKARQFATWLCFFMPCVESVNASTKEKNIMATVILNWIKCINQQESNNDEIYFEWGSNSQPLNDNVESGEKFTLRKNLGQASRRDPILFSLWEQDLVFDDLLPSAGRKDGTRDSGDEVLLDSRSDSGVYIFSDEASEYRVKFTVR